MFSQENLESDEALCEKVKPQCLTKFVQRLPSSEYSEFFKYSAKLEPNIDFIFNWNVEWSSSNETGWPVFESSSWGVGSYKFSNFGAQI